MTLKQQLEKSPMISLVMISSAVASTVFAVMQYFHGCHVTQLKEDFTTRITESEARLSNIQLQVGDDNTLDLAGLVCSYSDLPPISDSMHYFAEDLFYALTVDDFWTYSQTTEAQLLQDTANISLEGSGLSDAANLIPVHLWHGDERFEIELEGSRTNLNPMIMMQRIPLEKLAQLVGLTDAEVHPVQQASFEADMENHFYHSIIDDMTGKFFQFQLWQDLGFSLNSTSMREQLDRVQKMDDMLISKSTMIMKDARVNGVATPVLYLHKQLILIANEQGLYMIKITIPSTEPAMRKLANAAVNRWLTHIKIVDE